MDKKVVDLQNLASENNPELSSLLTDLATAAKTIAKSVRRAGLIDLLGMTGETNIQGEEVQKLDEFSNQTFIDVLEKSETVAGYASEENDGVLDYNKDSEKAKYVVSTDPLDGSGNIDVNVSIGSIFSVFKRKTTSGSVLEDDFLQQGINLVCSGYFLYSTSTMLVYAADKGVNGFTLDPENDKFILSHPDIKIPDKGTVYSINESYSDKWTPELAKFINQLKRGEGIDVHNAKYIGALVADFHRILLKGGIFIYPASKKNPDGKLRLLYECNPMSYIVTQAGGMATNGKENILDIIPKKIHQRTPLFIGSKVDIELLNSIIE
jgi:fructose-1,6-bisphosphatase I